MLVKSNARFCRANFLIWRKPFQILPVVLSRLFTGDIPWATRHEYRPDVADDIIDPKVSVDGLSAHLVFVLE
jgi:hypothetical protein